MTPQQEALHRAPGHPYFNSVQYKLSCALEALTEAMSRLDKDSMEWAQCFDSANDMRELLGQPREPLA